MSGTPIEMHVALAFPPVSVRDAAMHVMRAVGAHEAPYRDLTLSIELSALGGGHVSVPIDAHIVNRPDRWECGIHIAAAQRKNAFPTFDGTLSVTPDGGKEAELWLQGSYVAPGGALGKGLDATLLHGLAERSLREFLSWLAGEVTRAVSQSERERMNQAMRYHG